jgi:hypothetical protein
LEPDRAHSILLPSIPEGVELPASVSAAREGYLSVAVDLAAKATAIRGDTTLSETGKAEKLALLYPAVETEIAKFDTAIETFEAQIAEERTSAREAAVAQYEPARTLAVQTRLAGATLEQRMTAAALLTAPAAFDIKFDEHVLAKLHDVLIDDETRTRLEAIEIALERIRSGERDVLEHARKLTGVERSERDALDPGGQKSEARLENAIAGKTSSTETTPKKQEDDTIPARQTEEAEQDAADPTHEKEIPPEK